MNFSEKDLTFREKWGKYCQDDYKSLTWADTIKIRKWCRTNGTESWQATEKPVFLLDVKFDKLADNLKISQKLVTEVTRQCDETLQSWRIVK